MPRCLEVVYTDVVGREVFRELRTDAAWCSPTAIRHRDGMLYVLVAEAERRVVYRTAPDQQTRLLPLEWCNPPATLGALGN